jgi:hypothetical protein
MADTDNSAADTFPPVPPASSATTIRPRESITSSVWVLGFMPVITVCFTIVALWVVVAGLPNTPHWSVAGWLVVSYPLTVIVAAADARQLRTLQHPRVASWGWSLLGAPIYLIIRTRALRPLRPGGWAPMWVAVVTGTVVATVVWPFTVRLIYSLMATAVG